MRTLFWYTYTPLISGHSFRVRRVSDPTHSTHIFRSTFQIGRLTPKNPEGFVNLKFSAPKERVQQKGGKILLTSDMLCR